MAFWNREKPYDRTRILAAAEKARSRGRIRKAITHYRQILAVDPADAHVNGRIGALLAKVGEPGAALQAFETAAQTLIRNGFRDRSVAVYLQAVEVLPQEERLWTRIAELNQERGRVADAVKTLMKGAQQLGKVKGRRGQAVGLLERALALEPFHLQATLNLGRLLGKEGRKEEALRRLEALLRHHPEKVHAAIRKAQFQLAPGVGTLWRWFRAGRLRSQPTLPPSVAPR